MSILQEKNYVDAFRGNSTSLLRWHHLDEFWGVVKQQAANDWFIYAVGEIPPEAPANEASLVTFIDKIDILLHQEHDYDYCGIVYADNTSSPAFIKIFDPNNLGVSCGFSESPPLPGWILSKIKPVELASALNPPNNRRRWWQKIFD